MWAGRRWTRRISEGRGVQIGTKISGVSHLVLVGWAVYGGTFTSDPLPFEVQNVSVITAEEFAAMTARLQPPDVVPAPVALTPSEPDAATPEVSDEPEQPPEQDARELVAQPAPEIVPETQPEPVEPDVAEVTPQPEQPEVVFEPQETPPEAQPRPIDRVAPVPVAAPPPDAVPAEVETPLVSADKGAETPQDQTEAQAPEEATDRIVTEADEPASLAPTRSPRPPARPTRAPVVASTAEKPPATNTEPKAQAPAVKPADKPAVQTGVNDALAQALGNNSPASSAPTGPPLTGGEKDALRVAVSNCWNVGSLSSAALRTTVVVGVSMSREGKPEIGSIRLLSSSGGADSAAKQAYEAARRAIIRCGSKGFKLPVEKYSRWRDIEMTFNPERMRIR